MTWKERKLPYSPRGLELYWSPRHGRWTVPVVTVENYCKWYSLFVVHPDGRIESAAFPDLGNYEKLGSPYVDHEPNPRHVLAWALHHGYKVDTDALGAICECWNRMRMEAAGLDGYEIHPADTLGKGWEDTVREALQK